MRSATEFRRESESGSIPAATFLYDGLTPVRTTTGSLNADLLGVADTGEVFSRTGSSGTMVPLHDAIGSTIALVDGTGKIVTQYTYQPFGKPSVTGTANANPFQFAAMEYDSTGLYHTWARYYSPGLQRFLSEDPLKIGGGDTNIFAYVQNDPVDMIDPLGLNTGSAGGGDYWVCLFYYHQNQPFAGHPEVPQYPEFRKNEFQDIVFIAPFKRLPLKGFDRNDSPGEGWIFTGRNWWYPGTQQSLSSDLLHGGKKGGHWDLHQRGKPKLSLRMFDDQLQFFSEDLLQWFPIELLP